MATTDELVSELISRKGDIETLAAWCIGYIDSLERSQASAIKSLSGAEPPTSLIDNLTQAIENRHV